MTDGALAVVAERTAVFARVSPAQKNRIILALKARDHVGGFMGDGINDAPSLHAVDVAKDAADIILQRRDLAVLHTGILEGRRPVPVLPAHAQRWSIDTIRNFMLAIGAISSDFVTFFVLLKVFAAPAAPP